MPQLNCCVIAMMGMKTKMDVKVIKDGLRETLIRHPRFSSKLVFDAKEGKPVGWVKTEVNIDNHITVPDLDPNMDSPDEFVEDYVSNLTKIPMDFTKPIWDLHILNIKTSDANSLAVFRIHHFIGDGVSLISLLLACTRKSSDPEALPSLPIDKNKKKKNLSLSGSHGFLSWFLVLFLIFKVLWNTLVDLGLFMATMIFLKDTNTCLKGLPGTEREPKRLVHRTFSLDDIKLVKNAVDVTINDVVWELHKLGYLLISTGSMDLAGLMEGDCTGSWEWGNSIGYMFIPIHIALRDDPLDYVRDAQLSVGKKKQSLETQCTHSSVKFILDTLGLKRTAALTYRVFSNVTLSFSNVVGPMDEISFYGHPIAFLAPSVYGNPQALIIHFQSYMNQMTLVVAVNQDVIPDPHQLCDDIEESLKCVKNNLVERKLVKS